MTLFDAVVETDGPRLLNLLMLEEDQQAMFERLDNGDFIAHAEALSILEANRDAGVLVSRKSERALFKYFTQLETENGVGSE